MQIEKPKATVKSLHKVGKCEFKSNYGMVVLEVTKQKGGNLYYICIDERYTGLCRSSALDSWELLGDYLDITVVEGEVK